MASVREGTPVGLAGRDARIERPRLVLAEHVVDLAAAHADVTGGTSVSGPMWRER